MHHQGPANGSGGGDSGGGGRQREVDRLADSLTSGWVSPPPQMPFSPAAFIQGAAAALNHSGISPAHAAAFSAAHASWVPGASMAARVRAEVEGTTCIRDVGGLFELVGVKAPVSVMDRVGE